MSETTSEGEPAAAPDAGLGSLWELLKPRVMSLVVFSGIAGYYLAPASLHPFLAVLAIACIAVGAGAAGAINMVYDRDIDALMYRTRRRPVVTGKVSPDTAMTFGVMLAFGSVGLMGLATNWLAAFWLAVSILFYVFVYTIWLKRRTAQNIVIGGAAGAFPPVIGWAAATGDMAVAPWVLFALIFFWTPPHFWALALYVHGDYARANVPMLPVTHGQAATRRHILAYTIVLVPLALAPYVLGVSGIVYLGVAVALSGLFVAGAVDVLLRDGRNGDHRPAKRLFGFSILYLFALLAAMMIDKAPGLLA